MTWFEMFCPVIYCWRIQGQYKYLHRLMVEYLTLSSQFVSNDAFANYQNTLLLVDKKLNKTGLLLQYEVRFVLPYLLWWRDYMSLSTTSDHINHIYIIHKLVRLWNILLLCKLFVVQHHFSLECISKFHYQY